MIELAPLWEGPWWSDLLGLFGLGGVMMVPLGICSVLTFSVIIERIWSLRSGRLLPGEALRIVRQQVAENPGQPSKLTPENTLPVDARTWSAASRARAARCAPPDACFLV